MKEEMYGYFLREQQKNPTKPYSMSNSELAAYYYSEFKRYHPEASLHEVGITQYICQDNRARKKLAKILQEQRKQIEEDLQRLGKVIAEVEGR